jgi:AcrR family transcriptional regulator
MDQSRKAEPRWERRKEARPQELIAAALELFVERGFAATRLEDVASRAGVSKGTLYLYFDSKEALFKEAVRTTIVPAIGEAERFMESFAGSAADLIRNIVMGWWKLIGSTPAGGIPKLITGEAGNFPELAKFYHDEVVVRALGMMMRALKRGVDTGEFRAVDTDAAVLVMVAPLVHYAIWSHSLAPCAPRHIDAERYFGTYLDLLFNGLGATRPGSPDGGK